MVLVKMSSAKFAVCLLLFITGLTESLLVNERSIHAHALRHKVVQRKLRAANDGTLRFDPKPLNKNVELDGIGKISCKVAGGTAPNVQWFLNSEDPLPPGVTSQNGTLHIARAATSHAGQYTCRARDGDTAIETTINVAIVVKPMVISPAPMSPLHALVGTEVRVECLATGTPSPTVHWIRGNTFIGTQEENAGAGNPPFDLSRFSVEDNSTLVIRDVSYEDADRYACMAGSLAGLDRSELILHVHNATDMPVDSASSALTAVLMSMFFCTLYIALVVVLILVCRQRRRKRRERVEKMEMEAAEGREKLVDEEEGQKLANGTANHNGNLRVKDRDSATENSESCVSRASKRSCYDQLTVSRTLLTELIVLGRGEFGDVLLAKLDFNQVKKLKNKDFNYTEPDFRHVIAKILTNKDENLLCEFRRQLDMLSRVRHDNVARLVGLCNEIEPHYMVLEHTDWGDLKQFLLATRTSTERDEYTRRVGRVNSECELNSARVAPPLLPVHMLQLARYLARAAQHLALMKFTHRDIASRNCVITSKLYLKLSFPAMTKGPYSQEYYKLHDQVIPLRWLPSEAVLESDYSTKSDVYMYAATVWEIYCKAELPFAKLNDNSIMERLKTNTLDWTIPPSMPNKLAELLKQCWSPCPSDRPQFDVVYEQVNTILKEHKLENTDII